MNIGIDIDGTITGMPEFFAALSRAFKVMGHKVYVITLRPEFIREETMADLKTYGIRYHKLYMCDQNIDLKTSVIKQLSIDVMFDDSLGVMNKLSMNENIKRLWIMPAGINIE